MSSGNRTTPSDDSTDSSDRRSASSDAEALLAVHEALLFFRRRRASPEKLREIAAPALGNRWSARLPLPDLLRTQIAAAVAEAEGRTEEAVSLLRAALVQSSSLGTVERSWRIHRDLALLEPEGSAGRADEMVLARKIVEGQARRFLQKELRSTYVAHPERAAVLGFAVTSG